MIKKSSQNHQISLVTAGCFMFVTGALCFPSPARSDVDLSLQKQRTEVLNAASKGEAGLPVLKAALKNPEPLIRRAAVRSLEDVGEPAIAALAEALKADEDLLVRRIALRVLVQIDSSNITELLEPALEDSDEMVRAAVVQAIANIHPQTTQAKVLLKRAQKDPSHKVSKVASDALWPFHEAGVSLHDRPQFEDHQLSVVQKIPFPKEDWSFKTDPEQTGHDNGWFDTNFNDSSWQKIEIEQPWEPQIGQDYDGIAWYRKSFTLPEKPGQDGTDIVFDGVDESTWVWINGQYIGQHDIGPEGWKERFAMDVTSALKWGKKNQITVRVLDTKGAGGIWKPVYLEVLTLTK